MKKTALLLSIMTLLLFVLPAPGQSDDEIAHPELQRITAKELKQLMETNNGYIIIDTRDSGSYSSEHIKGAINIHYDPSGDPMSRKMTLMAVPMDRLLILYCDCEDDSNSAALAMELYDLGVDMDMLKILSRGTLSWKEAGYPLVTE